MGFHFADELLTAMHERSSIVCFGIDPHIEDLPSHVLLSMLERHGRTVKALMEAVFATYAPVIVALEPIVGVAKINIAFFERYGAEGLLCYERLLGIARRHGVLVICDGKRGDGDRSAAVYADGHIGQILMWGDAENPLQFKRVNGPVRADALTIDGYIGEPCLNQYLERVLAFGTGVFVLTRTSFKPTSKIQNLIADGGLPVWKHVGIAAGNLNEPTIGIFGFGNVGAVVGATTPKEAQELRDILPSTLFLVPGFSGKQGASAEDAIAGTNEKGLGCLINMSTGIMSGCTGTDYVSVAVGNARRGRDTLNEALRSAGKSPFRRRK